MIQIQKFSHMLLVWTLNFVKLLWPELKLLSCTHDWDTRTPTNNIANSCTEGCAKHTLFHPPNNYSIQFFIISLSPKFHMPRRKIWAMFKKRREKRKSMSREWEKKWTSVQRIKQWVLRYPPKKKEREKKRKK
jgi:hypothetical protein